MFKTISLQAKLVKLEIAVFLELSGNENNNSFVLADHLETKDYKQKRRYKNNSKLKNIKSNITQL